LPVAFLVSKRNHQIKKTKWMKKWQQ